MVKAKLDIVSYSETGCPYGDRMRLSLRMTDVSFDHVTNDVLSGTVEIDGTQLDNVIQLGAFLEENGKRFFPSHPATRERQLKLAQVFEMKLTKMFNQALESNIHREEPYYMFMESLSIFENELIRSGRFFGGSEPGFLDIFIYPWIARVGIWTPEFLKGELGRIQSWRRRMKESDLISQDRVKGSRSDWLRFAKKLRSEPDCKERLQRLNSCGI